MASADTFSNSGIIDPRVNYVYRGFLLRIPSSMEASFDSISYVEYQVSVSDDASFWGDWEDLATVRRASKFSYIHGDLLSTIYYRYRARYTFTDTSQTDWSDYNISGAGGVDPSQSKIDETAASLGTITSGYMRGVVFETSASAPKIRMDPSGFYSVTTTSTPISILAGGSATFSGTVNASGVDFDAADISDLVYNRAERIRWLTTGTDGYANAATPTGQIYSYEDGFNDYGIYMQAQHPVDPVNSKAQIGGYVASNASFLTAGAKHKGGSAYSRTILSSGDTSSFLRFYPGHASNDAIEYGSATLSFVASNTATTAVGHNLGVTPTAIIVTPTSASFKGGITTSSSVDFTIEGRCDISTTDDRTFYWVAIG